MLDQARPGHDDPARASSAAGVVPVHFLMYNVDARDGVSRAVLTLANQFALTHPVEVISLYRRHGGPAYAISDRVRVTYLFDHPPALRAGDNVAGGWGGAPQYSRWPVTRTRSEIA